MAADDAPRDGDANDTDDVESPDAPSSMAAAAAPGKHLSAAPPRWRFVTDAKGTSGYSTLAAGRHVRGKSGEELAGKYVAPDVSLYKSKGEKPEVGKLQRSRPARGDRSEGGANARRWKRNGKIPVEDGTISSRDESIEVRKKAVEKKQNEVLGLLTELLRPNDPPSPDGPHGEDGDEDSSYYDSLSSIESNSSASSGTSTDQGKGSHSDGEVGENEAKEGTHPNSSETSNDDVVNDELKGTNPRRRHRFLYLMLLILLVLVIVLGVLLGKKNNAGGARSTADNAYALSGPTVVVNSTSGPSPPLNAEAAVAATDGPTAAPSQAPSGDCEAEARSFSIEHPREALFGSTLGSTPRATWILKNACSGEVVSLCLPYSSTPSGRSGERKNEFTRRTQHEIRKKFTQCLPSIHNYVLEVTPSRASSSYCEFDPETAIISFDNVVLSSKLSSGDTANGTEWSKRYFFGKSETLCNSEANSAPPTQGPSQKPSSISSQEASHTASDVPTPDPTESPTTRRPTPNPTARVTPRPSIAPTTISPTKIPSVRPISIAPTTIAPTKVPSAQPVAAIPTASPLPYLGACPETYGYLSAYTLGARVESYGSVYQCVRVSCKSYGLEPGRNWRVVGSCSNPTSSPSASPRKQPSNSPTTQPAASAKGRPTKSPTVPTGSPSKAPSRFPTRVPSNAPSRRPTSRPSKAPSRFPTRAPSNVPSRRPTSSPSKAPSQYPTFFPSNFPSGRPSASPSKKPTDPPTKKPLASPTVGPTQRTKMPTRSPSKAPSRQPTESPSNVPTGKPTSSPSKTPSKRPSASPSKKPSTSPSEKPSADPTKVPTKKPTSAPSMKPSARPTLPPTNIPTPRAVCSEDPASFSLCLAINMSGSLCNGPTGSLCTGCPQLFQSSNPQESYCRDTGVAWSACCVNFANVKELAAYIVWSLGNSPVEKSFSVVQFASDARVVSQLSSTSQTLATIGQLTYSGGLDNHAGGIQMCQQTLLSSSNEKKIIMLITDGETGMPDHVPKGSTESAATAVKNEGTYIFPVLVPLDPPDTNVGAIPMFSRISSSGEVFDFTDARTSPSVSKVQEELMRHVSCPRG